MSEMMENDAGSETSGEKAQANRRECHGVRVVAVTSLHLRL